MRNEGVFADRHEGAMGNDHVTQLFGSGSYKLSGALEVVIISVPPYILPALSTVLITRSLSLGRVIVGIDQEVLPSLRDQCPRSASLISPHL